MNYRESRGAYCNCEKRMFEGEGFYDIPSLNPCSLDLEDDFEIVGFNYALKEKHPEEKVLHFYLDDYQFERVWNDPKRYLPVVQRFRAVIAPDFSLYTDFPVAVQIFNHYRKMWCAKYWQENGVTVIPDVCWSTMESFEYCLDGMPQHSLVSVSALGINSSKERHHKFNIGYVEAVKRLKPTKILLFCGASVTEVPEVSVPVIRAYSGNLVNAAMYKLSQRKRPIDNIPLDVLQLV